MGLRRTGDVAKLRMAKLLHEETMVVLSWIAAGLQMGSKTRLAYLLYWEGRGEAKTKR